ncbi:galactose mutarotase-like domain-containing protein [Aspergillus undulatus]|uniref:galactose mutarotase-like domain-containing protein n=1 Tax=Aspergillus undulatus TaxID=1810928 RepID=UPI003CCD27D1
MLFWTTILSSALVAGLTVDETDNGIVVDVQGDDGFIVTIDSTGSISSLQYRETEYQYSGTLSHVASGLGSATEVSYITQGDYAVVSATIDDEDFNLTHYYVFQDGLSAIYMGTNALSQPSVGELRYIARLVNLPEAYKEGDVSDIINGEVIEGEDVYLVDGETRSKFYSSQRFIDDSVYCAYSSDSSVHACFLSDTRSREKSSGGPFFRDIDLNLGGDYHSVTYYMNSGHVQTEEYRTGFFGPYILSFSGSEIPAWSDFDVSFFDDLELDGYVASSERGVVTGDVSGTSEGFPAIVHFYNNDYQSWANATGGEFTSPELAEGSYTLALYQDELLAGTTTVDITAGATATASVSAANDIITAERTTIFQIGEYDGTPSGLRNADKQLRMHPSDSRMEEWNPTPFVVGKAEDSDFPMAIFADVNNNFEIQFTLDETVDAESVTVRIATTLAYAGGRPSVTLNDVEGDVPDAPSSIDSRGVTRGAYRGYGEVYTFDFEAGALVQGQNSVYLSVQSGSSGEEFLSPNVVSFLFSAFDRVFRIGAQC